MQKYKSGIFLVLALIIGAIAMDYFIYWKSKDKGYTKISGLFKYTAPTAI